jgi:hypothetical protein
MRPVWGTLLRNLLGQRICCFPQVSPVGTFLNFHLTWSWHGGIKTHVFGWCPVLTDKTTCTHLLFNIVFDGIRNWICISVTVVVLVHTLRQ